LPFTGATGPDGGRIAGRVNRGRHAHLFARRRRVLPSAHRRLTGKARAGARQLAQCRAKAWIIAQSIKVVGIFVVAADRQDRPRKMSSSEWITREGSRRSAIQPRANPQLTLGLRQQQTPPSEVNRPPSKAAVTFFLRTAGNPNGLAITSFMAGVASGIFCPAAGSA